MIEKVGGIVRINRISRANQESPYKKEDKDDKEKKNHGQEFASWVQFVNQGITRDVAP